MILPIPHRFQPCSVGCVIINSIPNTGQSIGLSIVYLVVRSQILLAGINWPVFITSSGMERTIQETRSVRVCILLVFKQALLAKRSK